MSSSFQNFLGFHAMEIGGDTRPLDIVGHAQSHTITPFYSLETPFYSRYIARHLKRFSWLKLYYVIKN